jgi:hypothetical protein
LEKIDWSLDGVVAQCHQGYNQKVALHYPWRTTVKVIYGERIRKDEELLGLTQQATQQLQELLKKSANRVTVEWECEAGGNECSTYPMDRKRLQLSSVRTSSIRFPLCAYACIGFGAISCKRHRIGSLMICSRQSGLPKGHDMPDKTHGELIRELLTLGTRLTERLDNNREDIKRFEAAHARTSESVANLSTRVTVLEHQVADLRRIADEGGRRWWSLLPPLLGALFGSLVAFLSQMLISYLRK